jgi:dihydroxyacetone kinase-like predicted kinase
VVAGKPSIGDLLTAIESTGAARVVVLPNDRDTQTVASAAAREAHTLGLKVSVVPTRSPVQALAALAVRDPGRRFEDDVIAMAEAAGACRSGEVCYASREALTVAGPCQPGDVLALVDGEVHLIGSDLADTSTALVDRMLGGGGELVTLLLGADAPARLADTVQAHVARHWPFVEVQGYSGGQPHYPLLVGVE